MFLQRLFRMGTPDPLRRALEHLDTGELQAAIALLEVASMSEEEAIADTARLYAAEALLQLGEEQLPASPESAIGFFLRAAEHQPGWADIHHRMGCLALLEGDEPGAAEHFDRAMAINPDYLAARLGRIETILGGAGGVLEDHLLRARELSPPEFGEAFEDLAFLVEQGEMNAARDRISQIRAEQTSGHRDRRSAAQRALRLKETDEALEILEGMLDEFGRFPDILHLCGLAWAQKDDPARAEDFFREALSHNPRFVRARVNLGLALMDQDRSADAEREFRAVLESAPDHPLALAALEELGVSAPGAGGH